MSYHFFVHNDMIFGENAVHELSRLIIRNELKNVLVIYDQGVKVAGIAEKVLAETRKVPEIKIHIFDAVEPNPSNNLIEKVYKIAFEAHVQGFIAIGGGSSIDTAKAVNILMTNPEPIGQYAGINKIKNPLLPLIAIPTTAGTSSEITNVSALIDTKAVCKYVIIDDKLVPSQVICDPEFTKTVPQRVTAATGMDAITHAVESYISNMATPLTKYHSLQGLKILYENLPKVVANGNNMDARKNMMLGCIITGFGFSNANLGLVHGIAHTLSAHFALAHGDANACVLPYVMEYNAESCPNEMIELAKTINLPLHGDVQNDKLVLAIELNNLAKQIHIRTLSEHGISKSDFELIADDVLKEPVLQFNPRQNITKEHIIAILDKAF